MPKLPKRIYLLFLPVIIAVSVFCAALTEDLFEISKNLDVFSSMYRELNMYYVDETKPGQLMKTAADAMLGSPQP